MISIAPFLEDAADPIADISRADLQKLRWALRFMASCWAANIGIQHRQAAEAPARIEPAFFEESISRYRRQLQS
ncbi:hypothetical protein ELI38_31715 (plasmid) [Rhizobium leguminosarum]|nr:hypothetical protein CHR56_33355 [Rhizobium leguminosarum bv. viciae]OOO45579.1 hypothetical protein BS629_22420 [Rhizobium leguminosarum bv. viciae USDA 2370]RWX27629.1 hypothetical protein EHH54_33420 [Rhizobium leguminosarum]NKJ80654.1 hypothetical protein [Rhizobium leguminosarum bv. viciae]NKK14021.1 hypothetical protein [Rhizobium leguminosarum bv. viciae]